MSRTDEGKDSRDVNFRRSLSRGVISGTLKPFVHDLYVALNELEKEHGEIYLFAIFQREHPLQQWDLIVAAPWLHSEGLVSLKTVCASVQTNLQGNEILKLSHVEILDCDDPIVMYLREIYNVPKGSPEEKIDAEELSDMVDVTFRRAYLLRCRKLSESSASGKLL